MHSFFVTGVLTYVRIFSGSLKEGDSVFNVNRDLSEKISRISIAYSNDFKPIKEVGYGNIVVVSGLKETITGDTLVSGMNFAKKHPDLKLAGVKVADPVFFCSIEPPSISKQKQLDKALINLSREDPSLRVQTNENDQTILSGMGELHMEVVLERIRKEYKIDADLGPLMVAYKEAPVSNARCQVEFERTIGSDLHRVELDLSVSPLDVGQEPTLTFSKNKADKLNSLRPWQAKALERGFSNAIVNGPLLGYPVLGASFELHGAKINRNTSETIIAASFVQASKQTLKEAQVTLLEPVMKLSIQCDPSVLQTVVQDALMRRGQIIERIEKTAMVDLIAHVPLSSLKDYSTRLRILTSGRAYFGMEFSHYELMDSVELKRAIKEVTGFEPK